MERKSDSSISSFSLETGFSKKRASDELDNTDDGEDEGEGKDEEDARTARWIREQEGFEENLDLVDQESWKWREVDVCGDPPRGRKRTRLG